MKLLYLTLSLVCGQALSQVFTYTELVRDANQIPLGYPVPIPVDSLLPIDGYRTYNSLNLRHQQLVDTSSFIQQIQIGQTLEQRPILSYRLSNNHQQTVSGAAKGSAVINGGIHAREWQTPEAVTGFIETLVEQQNDQHIHQYLLENLDLVIIPVLNVDGFLQTQRFPAQVTVSEEVPRDGRMRRKNMRDVDQDILTSVDNLLGVDLNRNNDPFFGFSDQSSSPDRSSLVHRGAVAGSEPEIQALQQAAIVADQDRLRFYMDTHSFTQIYFTPQTGNNRRNNLAGRVATSMQAANNFRYDERATGGGFGIGSTDEYFANTFEVPSFTLEIEPGQTGGLQYNGFGVSHDGFILPESEVARMREETSRATMFGLYTMAELPLLEAASIRSVDNDEVVFSGRWVASGGERTLNVSANQAIQAETEYQLRLQFNKPMRRVVNGDVASLGNLSGFRELEVALVGRTTEAVEWDLQSANGDWTLDDTQFARYQTDTYVLPFTLPSDFDFSAHELLALRVDSVDMVGQALDANPGTISDWQNGTWLRHENTEGIEDDSGGIDQSMRIIDDGSDLFSSTEPPPPPPPAPNPPAPTPAESSGGGSLSLWGLGLLLLLILERACSYYRLRRTGE
ncbi:hypothetical protein EYS14_00370 [Alteromonadaceae bacterium M269]|nr:hypothetical protein EYS14_00370 [Alteromonadaceae bacterium M269]